MWVKSIHLKNIKGFVDSTRIEFSRGINILVGANNSGKSTILSALHLLQPDPSEPHLPQFFQNHLRKGTQNASLSLAIADPDRARLKLLGPANAQSKPLIELYFEHPQSSTPGGPYYADWDGQKVGQNQWPIFPSKRPGSFIYPYLSGRRPLNYEYTVNAPNADAIEMTFRHIPSKLDRILSDSESAAYTTFLTSCRDICGFRIACDQYASGKQGGLKLTNGMLIPIEAMGSGTFQVAAFLSHLCSAEDQLFLVEELENDLHPMALKGLLDLIEEKSKSNQFIISTHNNIVVRRLGGVEHAKLFAVEMNLEHNSRLPISNCREVSADYTERLSVLRSLGYDVSDFYMWKAYLILEESSAERIINSVLIPHFVPGLRGQLRTTAACGVDDVEPRVVDFQRLFVFLHLESAYTGRAWVAVDGDANGQRVTQSLRARFSTWDPHHFHQFGKSDFERYYPENFLPKVEKVLAMPNGTGKQQAKRELLNEVIDWSEANPEVCKQAFKESAAEVIAFLTGIQEELRSAVLTG